MAHLYINGKQFSKQKQEKVWYFDKARNILIKKNKVRAKKNIFSVDFTK